MWSLHFLSSLGHRKRFLRSSLHREPACILPPGRCRRYTCRSRFYFLFGHATYPSARPKIHWFYSLFISQPMEWKIFKKRKVLKISVSRAIFPPNRNNHWWILLRIIHDFFSLKSKSNILLLRNVSEKQKNVTHRFWRHTYTQLSIQNI